MSLRVIVALFVLNSIVVFSQEKITKHTIAKGETISSIAEKYDVKQSAIFKLNPKAKNVLKLNSTLLIPVATTKSATTKNKTVLNSGIIEHQVQPKETPYGIAKQYGISLKELNEVNPTLEATGLQIGQKIKLPSQASIPDTTINKASAIATEQTTEFITISVLPKESKYSLARKYGITVKELDQANPTIGRKALRVGQRITIPGNTISSNEKIAVAPTSQKESTQEIVTTNQPDLEQAKSKEQIVLEQKTTLSQPQNTQEAQPTGINTNTSNPIIREVLPKETKYGIAKEYGLTVKELENQNPETINGLRVGDMLRIRPNNEPLQNNDIVNTEHTLETPIEKTTIDFNNALKPTFNHDFLDQLIAHAAENIGTRYRSGGTSKAGFDCSGLMCTTFGAFDIKLPRTSREQSSIGVRINTDEAQKGDLIFFKTNGRSQINHVGMVVEVCEGEIKFIHSSVSNGVIISSTKEKYYEKNFSQINRVLQN